MSYNFKKYKGEEVEVGLNIPITQDLVIEEEAHSSSSNEENIVTGVVKAVDTNSLTLEYEYRGRVHTYECFAPNIAFIHTSKLTAAAAKRAKETGERMKKARQEKEKEKGKKKKK